MACQPQFYVADDEACVHAREWETGAISQSDLDTLSTLLATLCAEDAGGWHRMQDSGMDQLDLFSKRTKHTAWRHQRKEWLCAAMALAPHALHACLCCGMALTSHLVRAIDLNRVQLGGALPMHTDRERSVIMVVLLEDDFEGGAFHLVSRHSLAIHTMLRRAGEFVVFDGHNISHSVEVVTRGARTTMAITWRCPSRSHGTEHASKVTTTDGQSNSNAHGGTSSIADGQIVCVSTTTDVEALVQRAPFDGTMATSQSQTHPVVLHVSALCKMLTILVCEWIAGPTAMPKAPNCVHPHARARRRLRVHITTILARPNIAIG